MSKVIIIIEDGLVQDVFAKDRSLEAEVLDMDTDDAELEKELQERHDECYELIRKGQLFRIY